MKKKSKSKRSSKSELQKPYSGKIKATLTFELPEAEEFLELTIQAWKWRQAVGDFMLFLMRWRDAAKTSEEKGAFRSAKLMLRDHLAEMGLSLHTRGVQEKIHQENIKLYSKHIDALIKKGKKLMEDDDSTEQDRGESQSDSQPLANRRASET